MCLNYKYFLQIKPEFDDKFKVTGIRTPYQYLCEVKDVERGIVQLNYDNKRFNLIVKECGQCKICKIKRASIKACQAQCEYKTSKKGTFCTFTFGHDKIKDTLNTSKRYKNMSYYKKQKYLYYLQWTLEKREFTNFMKRLRKYYLNYEKQQYCVKFNLTSLLYKSDGSLRSQMSLPNWCTSLAVRPDKKFVPTKIRYLHCGEYGSLKERPHHHAIIYGINFSYDDTFLRYSWKQRKNVMLHHNNTLSDLWSLGEVTVDAVTYQSCNYVARYITKKYSNYNKEQKKIDVSSSLYKGRLPEYCTQSNRPGLGFDYFIKNARKIISDKRLFFKNNIGEVKDVALPRYYKILIKRFYPSEYRKMVNEGLEKQLEISSQPIDVFTSRMRADCDKIKKIYSQFVGDYEYTYKNINQLNYYVFNLKKLVFNDFSDFVALYRFAYTDTDFVKLETKRVTCFKNFEKYRKLLYRKALQEYIIEKTTTNKTNLVRKLYMKKYTIDLLDNPFAKENIEIYRPDFEKWNNYETNCA